MNTYISLENHTGITFNNNNVNFSAFFTVLFYMRAFYPSANFDKLDWRI